MLNIEPQHTQQQTYEFMAYTDWETQQVMTMNVQFEASIRDYVLPWSSAST